MQRTHFFQRNAWLSLLAAGMLLSSCTKDNDIDPQTSSSDNTTINDWILQNMQTYYYWNDKILANPNKTLAPSDFFKSLLNTYDATTNPTGDRFSWIEDNADQLTSELSGQTTTTGMEFTLYLRSQNSENIIAQVLYVLPGSPAAKAGISRGDIISKVNGQTLSRSNYSSLLYGSVTSYTFGFATVQNQALVDTDRTVAVTATTFQEDPVFMDSVYAVGGKTIGYLVYNQFIPAPNGSKGTEYDDEVDAVFSKFKAQGVNELILDLRYNPGGYTSSSANLASLIGKGIDASKVYFREEWNSTITPQLKKEYGDAFFVQNFVNKSQNIGNNLQRIFVLTTDGTASASELIINGLRPFMPVTTVGTTTHGKNVGSITITDETGKISWGMQPIVFKSFNSLGQSDYSTGFTPTVEVEETIPLLPLGDVNETLLSAAMAQITGGTSGARRSYAKNPLTGIGSSVQRKAGGSNMYAQPYRFKAVN